MSLGPCTLRSHFTSNQEVLLFSWQTSRSLPGICQEGVLAYLCNLWARGGDAVKGQVHALGHVLAIAKVDQKADVHQVVIGAGLDVRKIH